MPPEVIMELNQQIIQEEQQAAMEPQAVQEERLSPVRYQTGLALKHITKIMKNPSETKVQDVMNFGWLGMMLVWAGMMEVVHEVILDWV